MFLTHRPVESRIMYIINEAIPGCAKGLLILLNLFCLLIAFITFGVAVVDFKILEQYGEEQTGGCYTGDVVVIVVTMMLAMVTIVGCVGTARNSVRMLNLYVGFVLTIVILELMVAIFVSLQRYGLQFRVTEWIRGEFYRNVSVFDEEWHHLQWDKLQTTYECCGLNSPEDYPALGREIPLSCCSTAYTARSDNAKKLMYQSCVETTSYYKIGCEDAILELIESNGDYLLGTVIISFGAETSGIVLAMWVARHLRNRVQVYKNTVRY